MSSVSFALVLVSSLTFSHICVCVYKCWLCLSGVRAGVCANVCTCACVCQFECLHVCLCVSVCNICLQLVCASVCVSVCHILSPIGKEGDKVQVRSFHSRGSSTPHTGKPILTFFINCTQLYCGQEVKSHNRDCGECRCRESCFPQNDFNRGISFIFTQC